MEASAGSPGVSGECEGEDQEESSSSPVLDITAALDTVSLEDDKPEETKSQDPLAEFRQQWHRELVSAPTPKQPTPSPKQQSPQLEKQPAVQVPRVDAEESDEDKAKRLFLLGIELEQSGKLYEAVQHYRRAVTLLPDVERRLYETMDKRDASVEVELLELEEAPGLLPEVAADDEDENVEDDDGDLIARFQRIIARKGRLCESALPVKGGHISWLPYEVVWHILRWVVSGDLDACSLERVASVCRGLYLAARDVDIWRAMCLRTWGLDSGTPKSHGFPTWRQMYIERPRLRLNGCYISKTTYLRHGENSFQDTFYKPWYLIEYYRYLRFFPEGLVLMWTTADEPASCVGHLKSRGAKAQGIMSGHYRLIGDKVVIVVKRESSERKAAPAQNSRFRSRRRDSIHEQHEQIFHLELQLRTVRSRRNWQLSWKAYALSSRANQWTSFEVTPGQYPPLFFSPVRNYTQEATTRLS